jgi:DNA-directed RNA polymerase specialized sigma24 family protein
MSLAMNPRSLSVDAAEKLAASIRLVLRRNGVPDADVPDLVQQVLLQAQSSEATPAEEPDRTRYIHAIARNVAGVRRGELAANLQIEPLAGDDELANAYEPAADHGSRQLAQKVLAEVDAHASQGLDWLLRAKVDGEPLPAIAASEGVPVDRVRQRVARLRRRMQSVAVALGTLATIVLLATFMKRWRLHDHATDIGPDYAKSETPPTPTPVEQAALLRRQAQRELVAGDATGCLRDLDEARTLDPAGDKVPETARARNDALLMLQPKDLDLKR